MPLLQLRPTVNCGLGGESHRNSVDIIAVHGLGESMIETWTDSATKILWLRDLLPDSLDVARVLAFGYNANVTSFYGLGSADRIQQHAQTLVADIQADRSLEGCSKRPLIFVCHGLGGILVKKALAYSSTRTSKHVEHLYSIFVSTYGILFFGTPHHGTDAGEWMASSARETHVSSLERSQLLSAIQKDSETLQAITDQFSSLMKQFHIFFFWEEIESEMEIRRGFVVEEASAAPIIDNTERAGIAASHVQMVRFANRRDSSYRTAIEALVRYCRHAPSIISRRWTQAEESLSRVWSNEAFELTGTAFDVHHNNRPFPYERKFSERPKNKHFYIPQVVSSIFTGREDISRNIKKVFLAAEDLRPTQQCRHVIYGIGGAGKTQFCSKFAQDHRERFWGVFWIDAASAEMARQSFAKLGTLGGLEATESAGKHWLSNAEEPWLLIINNADDPLLDLANLFPEGQRGHILVTTRNPNFKIHGTVGSTEFEGLKGPEALTLLLRAADTPRPWNSTVETIGNKITDTLGRLALALVQAGALIMQRICEIQDYLEFYDNFRSSLGSRRSSASPRNDDQLTIFATWEHSLDSLQARRTEPCSDAAQLLNTVAFFHFDHIRVDIFTRALDNRHQSLRDSERPSVVQKFYKTVTNRLQGPPILPGFLKQESSNTDQFRVRRALHELRSFSLISYDGKDDSFSLHPVVHSWARDRLNCGEQIVWAQVALNVLAESIQLPPNDIGEKHEDFRRDILVHLDVCLKARPLEIMDYEARFGGYRLPLALLLHNSWLFVFRDQVTTAAKCGYVYLERGRFDEAADIFSKVKQALVQSRGYKDEKTMAVMLALAATFWGLGRLEEGVALQKTVYNVRNQIHGPDDPATLSAMDQLGKSYWLNGEYNEALEIQTLAVERAKFTLGPTDERTLNVMDNLGVTYGSWRKYQESKEIHQAVLASRMKSPGPTHVDTLTTMNNLAMALMDLGILKQAQDIMEEVYERRKMKLGMEHPWTLWALCNLAKVKSELGLLAEAEEMLVGGIAAAKRSLGEDHLGVLMGVGELARIYARQHRLDESERLTTALLQRLEESRGPSHPDTVYALSKLAHLYEMQRKCAKAIETCKIALERAEVRLTRRHPLSKDIVAHLERLTEQGQHDGSEEDTSRHDHHKSMDESIPGTQQSPKHLRISKTF